MSQPTKSELEFTPVAAPSKVELKKEWVYPEIEVLPTDETPAGSGVSLDFSFQYS